MSAKIYNDGENKQLKWGESTGRNDNEREWKKHKLASHSKTRT